MIIEEKAAQYLRDRDIRLVAFADGQIGFLIPDERKKGAGPLFSWLRRWLRLSDNKRPTIDPRALIA